MNIYLAGSISGQSGEDVIQYFTNTAKQLTDLGFSVIHPMLAKGYFRNEIKFKAEGYTHKPMSTNHAIIERDRWMVNYCDILYCNLTMAKIVSIGSMMELAWAHQLGKHSIIAMQENNIHRHAFVLEAGDIIFESHPEVLEYLKLLKGKG
jgi:nucleoside 2-deoxyribosyltransferase